MSPSLRASRHLCASMVLLASLSATAALAGVPNPDGYVGKDTLGASIHIADYQALGLSTPNAQQEWLRLGRDAVLVDRTNGEVAKVVKDVFA